LFDVEWKSRLLGVSAITKLNKTKPIIFLVFGGVSVRNIHIFRFGFSLTFLKIIKLKQPRVCVHSILDCVSLSWQPEPDLDWFSINEHGFVKGLSILTFWKWLLIVSAKKYPNQIRPKLINMLDSVGLKIFNFFNFLFGFYLSETILLVIKISQNQYRMSHNLVDSMSITIFKKKKNIKYLRCFP